MTPRQNFYEILGIDNHASLQVIEYVYKNLQKAYHPDLHPENRDFYTAKIKLINQAFEILGNPVTREGYDKGLADIQTSSNEDNVTNANQNQDQPQNQNENKKSEENKSEEESFLPCRKCGIQVPAFLFACTNCGEWLAQPDSEEKGTRYENLKDRVPIDDMKKYGTMTVRKSVDFLASGYNASKLKIVLFFRKCTSLIIQCLFNILVSMEGLIAKAKSSLVRHMDQT